MIGKAAEVPKSVQTPPLPQVRELPAEEYSRLADFPAFKGGLPHPAISRILVAELSGPGSEIVGFWAIFGTVHVEPLWIHPEHRKRAGLVRRLWTGIQALLLETGTEVAFACISDEDAARNVPLAMRQGFERFPGDLYFVRVGAIPTPPATEE